MKSLKSINPWLWVPTLYFLEGIPYFLVNNISMVMFNQMGVPNGEMSFFTTLLYFPWALKFLWAPFVDLIKTKRWWFLTMQFLMLGLAVLTIFSIPQPSPEVIAAMGTEVKLFTGVLIAVIIMAFSSATHDIAADGFYMLALTSGVQAEMIGFRSVFYRLSNVFCNSVLLMVPGFIYDWTIKQGEANMPLAWKYTMALAAAIFLLMALWHLFSTPRPDSDKPNAETTTKDIIAGFGQAFATYFKKPALWVAILFMLLYRLPEGFLIKMIYPFLLGARETGGLGLTLQEVGTVYGIVGVVFLLIGGLLGGYFVSWVGLKKSFWWMAIAMTLPCLSFVYLGVFVPTNMATIAIAIAIEQIGYGFGFTAYMMYMMYFSDGEFKTSHYAICTSFMALSMILPGLVAGYIQEAIGYENFFWMVISCSVATFLVTLLAKRITDPAYGKNIRIGLPADRDLLKMIILTPITLGIYPIVVYTKISKEINIVASKYDGKKTMNYIIVLLLSVITLGIVPIIWLHRLCNRISNELNRRGIDYKFSAADFWLWAVGVSIITSIITYVLRPFIPSDYWVWDVACGLLSSVGYWIFVYKLLTSVNIMNADYNQKEYLENNQELTNAN